MSLINQALKLEQQKRQTMNGPAAPMVSRIPHRGTSDKMPLLLFGFAGMGMLLAASVTAIFYFGSEFLDSEKSLATATPPAAIEDASATPETPATQTDESAPEIAQLLGALSPDQLSTVQQMLLERENATATTEQSAAPSDQTAENVSAASTSLSELSRIQAIVDSFSVQGIRKSGQETRVFLNGKIRKIGDVVDIENRLQLIGFTETVLVFRDSNGQRFEKAL